MAIYIGLLVLLSLAAAYPLARNYLRSNQSAVAHRRQNYKSAVRGKQNAKPRVRKARRQHFKASSIVAGENCCPAVVKFTDERFLTEEAPTLPLEHCDRIGECKCTFRHHADRRCGDDRRNPVGSLSGQGQIGSDQINRRAGMDRRSGLDVDLDDIKIL